MLALALMKRSRIETSALSGQITTRSGSHRCALSWKRKAYCAMRWASSLSLLPR